MSDPKTSQIPQADPKKPLTNPALKKAMDAARSEDTPQNRNAVVNEVLRATFLMPVQVGFDGKPPRPDKDGKVELPKNTKVSFPLLSTLSHPDACGSLSNWTVAPSTSVVTR